MEQEVHVTLTLSRVERQVKVACVSGCHVNWDVTDVKG